MFCSLSQYILWEYKAWIKYRGLMLVCLIVSVIIGCIVGGLSGFELLGWAAGIFVFVAGLPGALIGGFMFDLTSYREDRADDRRLMSDFNADLREDERERRRQIRHEDYLDHLDRIESKRNRTTYNIDARSVHYHNHSEPRARDTKGRFISKKK